MTPEQHPAIRGYFLDKGKIAAASVDNAVNDQCNDRLYPALLKRLAEHYNVNHEDLLTMLLNRHAVVLHSLTDYDRPATEADLQRVLGAMNQRVSDLVEQMMQRLNHLDEAIRQTELIHREAVCLLGQFRQQFQAESGLKKC